MGNHLRTEMLLPKKKKAPMESLRKAKMNLVLYGSVDSPTLLELWISKIHSPNMVKLQELKL